MVRLAGLEPATGKTPADFKPAAYANFATAAPNGHAARKAYHVRPRCTGQEKESYEEETESRGLTAVCGA